MKTIRKYIGNDPINYQRAEAEAKLSEGVRYIAIADGKEHRYMRDVRGCVKVVLVTLNIWGDRRQETFYCAPDMHDE